MATLLNGTLVVEVADPALLAAAPDGSRLFSGDRRGGVVGLGHDDEHRLHRAVPFPNVGGPVSVLAGKEGDVGHSDGGGIAVEVAGICHGLGAIGGVDRVVVGGASQGLRGIVGRGRNRGHAETRGNRVINDGYPLLRPDLHSELAENRLEGAATRHEHGIGQH